MGAQGTNKPKIKGKKAQQAQNKYVDQQYYFRDLHYNREIYEYCCAKLKDPNLPASSRDFCQSRKNYFEAHPELLDRPIEFEEQVEIDVDRIIGRGLNKGIESFGIKLERVAESIGLSIAWLSNRVSYSPAQFNRFCSRSSTDVPKELLTELCLLCRTDPYRILGLDQNASVDPAEIPLIKPLAQIDPSTDNVIHYILDVLCVPGNQEKFTRLQLIIKIARLKDKKYGILLNMLENIPRTSRIHKNELPDVSDLTPFMWMPLYHAFSDGEVSLVGEAFNWLQFHRRNDSERLFLLAKLATAGDDVWSILKAILITGGFPASRNSYLDRPAK